MHEGKARGVLADASGRNIGFRALWFRALGFRALGFRVSGF